VKTWFPAKRYGWGWGMPTCWQGWVVLALFAALLILSAVFFRGVLYFGCVLALSLMLVAVCWWKGEKPRWRWGDRE
jgi:hypothetical protein